MWKYFTDKETRKWTDILDAIVKGYNSTYHSSIKMTPIEASKQENSEVVWWNIYGAYITADYGSPQFKIGETVRISKHKRVFDKGYLPSFTEEYFKIKQVLIGNPIVYKLEDLKGEDLIGFFYETELSDFKPSEETNYKVEKVIGKKKVRGKNIFWLNIKGGLTSLMNGY
jgi:hypothetical protein